MLVFSNSMTLLWIGCDRGECYIFKIIVSSWLVEHISKEASFETFRFNRGRLNQRRGDLGVCYNVISKAKLSQNFTC